MNLSRKEFLEDLETFGILHDQQTNPATERMLNITADTGQFLSLLIKATQAKTILEVGTSNGYSTIWLADAAETTNGHVTTLEK
ncbi:MAG: hypothetical protein QM669_08930 [Siphonobacter sp.]